MCWTKLWLNFGYSKNRFTLKTHWQNINTQICIFGVMNGMRTILHWPIHFNKDKAMNTTISTKDSTKIFCKPCRFRKLQEVGESMWDIELELYCKHPQNRRTHTTPIQKETYLPKCVEANRNNDCPHYEPSWIFFKKIFRYLFQRN